MSSKIKSFLLCMILGLALGACAHTGKEQKLVDDQFYFQKGRHYTHAIYNSDNLLISHPYEDWLKASEYALKNKKPYTDLYVISHGWNFIHQEALANFNRYLEIWDKKPYDGFRPYIIFVVWNSTSRPLAETMGAVLPFGIDESLGSISGLSDGIIHLTTGWKQSLNADHNALGRHVPIDYKKYTLKQIDGDRGFGSRDIPLSMILYEIIKANNNEIVKASNERFNESNPDTYEPQKIHLVGHSYGAKLISMASLEALYRIYSIEIDESSSETDEDPEEPTPPPPATTFESLVLLNAAFHPQELHYYYNFEFIYDVAPRPIPITEQNIYFMWSHIPRKALVYSNTDLATGILYNTGQVIFNTNSGQYADAFIKLTEPDSNSDYILVKDDLLKLSRGVLYLAYNFIVSPVFWAGATLVQIPTDFYHHVVHNDTFGESPYWKFLNIPHFFLPLDKLNPFWGGDDNFSDHQGLWRSTLPAIGRTGLHHLGKWDSGAFGLFVANDITEKESSNIDAKQFNLIACSLNNSKTEPGKLDNENLFYSFDGSEVYDSWFSHGDLRSKNPAEICGNENDEDENIIEKREATFNFLTKFTLGNRYPYSEKGSNPSTKKATSPPPTEKIALAVDVENSGPRQNW